MLITYWFDLCYFFIFLVFLLADIYLMFDVHEFLAGYVTKARKV